jgi:Fe2+ transport system protein B
MNEKTKEAIDAFNIYTLRLINLLKPIILATNEIKDDEFNSVEKLIKTFIMPGNPKLIVSLLKKLIFDNYGNFIDQKDDSLFSYNGIMAEYKNIFNLLKDEKIEKDIGKIGQILINKCVGTRTITKQDIDKQINKINTGEGEENLIKKKDKIKKELDKCRSIWDNLDTQKREEIWKYLKSLNVLTKKYLNNF